MLSSAFCDIRPHAWLVTKSGGGGPYLPVHRENFHPPEESDPSRHMAIQKMGGRGRVAAELLEQRRSSHCDDRKQVRPGHTLLPPSLPASDPTPCSHHRDSCRFPQPHTLSSFSFVPNERASAAHLETELCLSQFMH